MSRIATVKDKPRTLLITGASTGIGYTCAQQMLERGWRVFATARSEQAMAELTAMGCTAIHMEMWDLSSIDAGIEELFAATDGQLTGVFNNAAYGLNGALEDVPTASLRAQLECNLLAWHHLTCKILPTMRQQGYGRVVLNSSILGFVSIPWRGPYTISKYALEGWADTLRLELHGSGVMVSLIQPGPIRSEFRANAYAAFLRAGIDTERSQLREHYRQLEGRFKSESGAKAPFELGPQAVGDKLIHALESNNPRGRYAVTFPTHLFAYLKRLLSGKQMDWLLRRIG